ncbi:MAG: FprA family A-type flavoprotein [Bacteroidales bacterium]|nr:FprA family A-type flavoprotein [Bacteroidales bacterium]
MKIDLGNNVYWIGMNDGHTRLLKASGHWSRVLPIILFDKRQKKHLNSTVELEQEDGFLEKLFAILNGEDLHYLVINHIEPDHSGAIKSVLKAFPNLQIVGNSTTIKLLDGYYGIKNNIYKVQSNSALELGHHRLRFIATPMLHWPETMMCYEEQDKILFTGDVFGSFGQLFSGLCDDELEDIKLYTSELRRYYAVVLSKYARNVLRALNKIEPLDIKALATTHGPVWRKTVREIMAQYRHYATYSTKKGVVIAYGSMYGHARQQAIIIKEELEKLGVEDLSMYDVALTDASYILSDILRYKGLILCAPTYNGEVFPPMEHLMRYMERFEFKNKILSLVSGKTWTGGGMKQMLQFADRMQWPVIGEPHETICAPEVSDFEHVKNIARAMAKALQHLA